MKDEKINNGSSGFTLVELLVVMTILGILATVGLGSFRSSQEKSRDARRKSDLAAIQKGLEMYQNDHVAYPASDSSGQIVVPSVGSLPWKNEDGSKTSFQDSKETIYIKELPNDPMGHPNYCYYFDSAGKYYKLYARLENANDPAVKGPYTCGAVANYNFGVSSSNINL